MLFKEEAVSSIVEVVVCLVDDGHRVIVDEQRLPRGS